MTRLRRRRWQLPSIGGPGAVALAIMLILYAGWQVFRWPPGHREVIGDVFFFPVDGAAVWAAWSASRRCGARSRLRSAWGLLVLPGQRRSFAERIRFGLDLAVVGISGAAVVTYIVLGPTITQAGPDALQTSISIAYPVGDVVLLVGLRSVLLRSGPGLERSRADRPGGANRARGDERGTASKLGAVHRRRGQLRAAGRGRRRRSAAA